LGAFVAAVLGLALGIALASIPKKSGAILGAFFACLATGYGLGIVATIFLGALPSLVLGLCLALLASAAFAWFDEQKELGIGLVSGAGIAAILIVTHIFVPFLALRNIQGQRVLEHSWQGSRHVAVLQSGSEGSVTTVAVNGTTLVLPENAPGFQKDVQALGALPYHILQTPKTMVVDWTGSDQLALAQTKGQEVQWLDPSKIGGRNFLTKRLGSDEIPITEKSPVHAFQNADDTFDLIVFTAHDRSALAGAAPLTFFGKGIFDQETFTAAFDSLSTSGALFFIVPAHPTQTVHRLVLMSRLLLEKSQVANPDAHIFVAQSAGQVAVLVKKEPFSLGDISMLLDECSKGVAEIRYSPFRANPAGPLTDLSKQPLDTIFKSEFGSLHIPRRDAPGFFTTTKKDLSPEAKKVLRPYFAEKRALKYGALLSGLAALACMFIPLFATRVHRLAIDQYALKSLFFGSLSAGSTLAFVALANAIRLCLPHPWLGSVGAFPLWLIGLAAGAVLAHTYRENHSGRTIRIVILILFGVAAFAKTTASLIFPRLTTWAVPAAGTLILSVGLVTGAAVLLAGYGVLRPHRNNLPWYAGVCSSCFVFAIAIAPLLLAGFGQTFLLWTGLALVLISMGLYRES
jgi:MFS family permease